MDNTWPRTADTTFTTGRARVAMTTLIMSIRKEKRATLYRNIY